MKRLITLVILLALAQPVWAEKDDCQPLDVYVRAAKVYLIQQKIPDFNAAQKQLDRGIACYPEAPEPRFILSKIMYRKRMYDKFLSLAQSLDTLDTEKKFMDSVWAMRQAAWGELFNRGVDSLKASNRVDSMRAEADVAGETVTFDSLTNLGRQYLQSAKNLFLASLEMDSSRSEPFQNLGVIDVRLQNWDEALVWYRKSLDTKPGDPDLLRNLMSLNMRQNQNDSAMHYARALLVVTPDDLEALTNEAGLYAKLGFPDSANMVFEAIIEKDPNNKPVLFNLGMTQVQRAQSYAEQITRYSQQANEFTSEYNKLAASGGNKSKLKDLEEKRNGAISSLKEAKSDSEEAWGQAHSLFQRLAGLDSTDHEARYFWGMSEFWLEKYDSSLVPLQEAVALKPDYCEAWQLIKFAAARAGQTDLAATAQAELSKCGS